MWCILLTVERTTRHTKPDTTMTLTYAEALEMLENSNTLKSHDAAVEMKDGKPFFTMRADHWIASGLPKEKARMAIGPGIFWVMFNQG